MQVAVLETGAPPPALAGRFGRYPAMIARMIGPGSAFETFDATAGEFPAPDAFTGVLVTGSAAGVYDELPWTAPLLDHPRPS